MSTKRGGDFGASWVASGDLSASQYRIVEFSGVDVFQARSGAAGGAYAGVLQNKPTDGQHAAVIGAGFSKITLAGSLASGIEVMAGANGRATVAASGQWCAGTLLTGGTAANDVGELLMNIHKKGAY